MYKKNTEREQLERARFTRGCLTVERSPISGESSHFRPLGFYDTELQETVSDYVRKRECDDDAPSIENCHSIGHWQGHILFCLERHPW